jgi:hypothetical protein
MSTARLTNVQLWPLFLTIFQNAHQIMLKLFVRKHGAPERSVFL